MGQKPRLMLDELRRVFQTSGIPLPLDTNGSNPGDLWGGDGRFIGNIDDPLCAAAIAAAVNALPALLAAAERMPPPDAGPDLLEALIECADDLENELRGRYDGLLPAMQGRFERDMGPVTRARALIAKVRGE